MIYVDGLFQGKRSLADHMNEAVNHIKHLQTRIKELGSQRNDLKIQTSSSPDLSSTTALGLGLAGNLIMSGCSGRSSSLLSAGNCSTSRVAVHPCLGGVEIVISYGAGDCLQQQGVVLSRLMQILLEQGLTVISCATTQVNKRLVYTIQSEVATYSLTSHSTSLGF